MKKLINQKILHHALWASVFVVISSCTDLLDVELDKSLISTERVYSDDVVANAAMNGIYSGMLDPTSFASGSDISVTSWSGLLADELNTYSSVPAVNEFAENELTPANSRVLDLWSSMYKTVYQTNAVLNGLAASTALTFATREQLEGEARFVRAFSYFYLVNFFGEVPLITATDFRVNAVTPRTAVQDVYRQIREDLDVAEAKLSPDYNVATGRIRPNRSAATALKARVALFTERWSEAEEHATTIIDDGKYKLGSLDDAFKIDNQEAIWQLQPVDTYFTNDGYYFILLASPADGQNNNALREDFLVSFEAGDGRRDAWVGSFTDDVGGGTWYYPYKYKANFDASFLEESSTVFRLAEQYLIRAEARLRGGNMSGAIADVDSIRSRAALPLVSTSGTTVTSDSLFSLIQHERRIELFAEWGHRWFDLKRLDALKSTIGVMKPEWNDGDELLPIPQEERIRNPHLGEQNQGYF